MKLSYDKINPFRHNNRNDINLRKFLFYTITSILFLLIMLTFIIMASYSKKLFKNHITSSIQPEVQTQQTTITEMYTTTDIDDIETTSTTTLVKTQNKEKTKQETYDIIITNDTNTQQIKMYLVLRYFGVSEQNTKEIVKATFEELPNLSKYGFTYEDVVALIYLESSFKNHSPYYDNGGIAVGYFSIHNIALERVKKQYPQEFCNIKSNRDLLKSPYYQTKVALRYMYIIIQSEIKNPEQHSNIKYYVLSRYNGRTTNLYNNSYIRVFNDRLSQVKRIIQEITTMDL